MRNPDIKPKFKHDCEKCVFLGHAIVNGEAADFYVHNKRGQYAPIPGRDDWGIELLYRQSDDCQDYGCTEASYVSPLNLMGSLALALYVEYLEANGADGFVKGTFYKDGATVLKLNMHER
jgi:hypothetical protein